MPTFTFTYEYYTQSQGAIDIEADSFTEAVNMAREIDPGEIDFEMDYETETDARLFSIECDSDTVASVKLPSPLYDYGWTHLDLLDQLEIFNADRPPNIAEALFEKQVLDYCRTVQPKVSDEVRAELEAERLRRAIGAAIALSAPIRI